MKVKFLKPHNGNLAGSTQEVTESLGNYLIRCNVAELDKPKKEKKVIEPDLNKK